MATDDTKMFRFSLLLLFGLFAVASVLILYMRQEREHVLIERNACQADVRSLRAEFDAYSAVNNRTTGTAVVVGQGMSVPELSHCFAKCTRQKITVFGQEVRFECEYASGEKVSVTTFGPLENGQPSGACKGGL